MRAEELLLLAGDRPGLALAGARVGVGALAADRKAPAVPQPPGGGEVHQLLDVHRGVGAKVALDAIVAVDRLADVQHFLVGEILDSLFRRNAELLSDLLGRRPADSVDVGQRDLDALVGGDVDPRNSSHSLPFFSSTGRQPPHLDARKSQVPERKTDARTNAPPGYRWIG